MIIIIILIMAFESETTFSNCRWNIFKQSKSKKFVVEGRVFRILFCMSKIIKKNKKVVLSIEIKLF